MIPFAERMISANRQALLESGLADVQYRAMLTRRRIEEEQEILREQEASEAELLNRLDELHRLRKEAQS